MTYRILADGVEMSEANTALLIAAQKGDGYFFEKKLTTDPVFGRADFAFWAGKLTDADCSPVDIEIQVKCGGDWQTVYSGQGLPKRSKYDFDRCHVTVRTQPNDLYSCIRKRLDEKYNWLNGDEQVVKTLHGTIETTTCFFSGTAPFGGPSITLPFFYGVCWSAPDDWNGSNIPDPTLAWRPIAHQQIEISPGNWSGQTEWGREVVTSGPMPPGSGWVDIGGGQWARGLVYAVEPTAVMTTPTQLDFTSIVLNIEIDNGVLLNDSLANVIGGVCDITEVRSCFLGLNDDSTAPTNSAYTAAEKLKRLVLFQKSDVEMATADENAGFLNLSLKEMLEILAAMNLTWRLEMDGADLIFRIEHVSYFDAAGAFDLSGYGLEFENEVDFGPKSQQTYERFAMNEALNTLFIEHTITGPHDCTDGNEQSKTWINLATDVGYIADNPDAGEYGAMLIATDEVSAGIGIIDVTDNYLNGAMSWRRLLDEYFRWNRPFQEFYIQGIAKAAESLESKATLRPVTVKMCACDFVDFQPSGPMSGHPAGGGSIESWSWNLSTELLTLNLTLTA